MSVLKKTRSNNVQVEQKNKTGGEGKGGGRGTHSQTKVTYHSCLLKFIYKLIDHSGINQSNESSAAKNSGDQAQ